MTIEQMEAELAEWERRFSDGSLQDHVGFRKASFEALRTMKRLGSRDYSSQLARALADLRRQVTD